MYYLNNFLFFSIFGFFFETSIFKIIGMHNQSGFMYLWWTPFYGFGICISILVHNYLKKIIQNKLLEKIILFIILFILLTILELIGGHLLTFMHGYSLWNYEHIPLHMGKYVSVPTSLAWSLMSIIYLIFIQKYVDKLINKIPKWLTILTSLIFFIDFILTLIKLISIKWS